MFITFSNRKISNTQIFLPPFFDKKFKMFGQVVSYNNIVGIIIHITVEGSPKSSS